jgi:hypothetical protein
MAYWKDWKSGVGGGIGLLILGIFLLALYTIPGGSGGRTTFDLDFMEIGLMFIVVGIILLIFGFALRKE